MRILHIFELLPYIHAGNRNKLSKLERLVDYGASFKTQVTPTGGTQFLLKAIHSASTSGDVVVCTDREPTIKKDMYEAYKAGRKHDRSIQVDQGAAEYIFPKCNITVIGRAGYESDDIVYSLVRKFYNDYDKIYVYTGDSDLYFLVDKKVSIKPSSSRAKEVTLENYEKVAQKDGITYNCVTACKIVNGDSSDNIPPLPRDLQDKFCDLFFRPQFFSSLGSKDFVRCWCETKLPEAIPQVDLVFPLDVEDLPDEFSVPSKVMMRNFGDCMNCNIYVGQAEVNFDVRPYVEEMQNMGLFIEEEDLL